MTSPRTKRFRVGIISLSGGSASSETRQNPLPSGLDADFAIGRQSLVSNEYTVAVPGFRARMVLIHVDFFRVRCRLDPSLLSHDLDAVNARGRPEARRSCADVGLGHAH